MQLVKRGDGKLLYVAPESLLTPRILSLLSSLKVDLLTINKAHCISEWGHDFLPKYRQLVEVRKLFSEAVCLALIAIATALVRQVIHTTLKFATDNEFIASFNRESLLTISGVGQVKLCQYGDAFLEVMRAYCEKRNLKEIQKKTTREKSDSNRRYNQVSEAYNRGETIQILMERYRVKEGTILNHLTRYLLAGNNSRNGEDMSELTSATPEQHHAAFAAFDELSPSFLKPVFDKLSGELNYDKLKILRMLYMVSQQG